LKLEEVKVKISILWCGLAIGLGLLIPISHSILAQELILDSLIAEALRANPDLKAAEQRFKAFEAQVPQVGSLPNPMFQTTVSNVSAKSWTLGKAPMSGVEFMLSQTFPFPGKLGLIKSMTKSMAQKSRKEYESASNFVISELKQNYYQLYSIEKSIEITWENKLLLKDFSAIAQTKYSVGEGLMQDVLKAQVEVSKMTDELISMEAMRRTTRAKINILLNRNPEDSLGKPQKLSFKKVDYSEQELQNLAVDNNPELKGMELMVNASNAEYKLARREYWPDFNLSLSWMRMKNVPSMNPNAERDFVSASAGVELPLYFWSKQKKKVQEKSFALKSFGQQYEGMKNNLKFNVSEMFYSLEKYKSERELYQTAILPQAQQSLESARSGYQVGKVDFLTLLDNQMTFYNYQIVYHQALSSYFQTLAQLEEMVGKSLLKEGE
jgi:cobalt-zinc-cadmium efflux system outer membrane protein